MMKRWQCSRWMALLVLVSLGGGCRPDHRPTELHVFAAASLTDVMTVLGEAYEQRYPETRVVISVAASSLLARQIAQGAPADVFLAAHPEWMDFLQARAKLADGPFPLVANEIVWVGAARGNVQQQGQPVQRLALADPDHVPAGRYAREALTCTGQWEGLAERVIPMLDVRAALLAAQTGSVDAAVVYATDVRDPSLPLANVAFPAECQPEIIFEAAQISEHAAAAHFLGFLRGEAQRAAWVQFGFDPVVP